MHRFAPFLAVLLTGAGLLAGNAATTRPAGTTPASRLVLAAVDKKKIDALVRKLASSRYRARRDARAGLLKIVDLPGVAEALKAHLKTTKDPEVRASLEHVLTGYDLPLAMVWYRGGLRELPRIAPAPWLFIRADGGFFIDKASSLFTGGPPSSPAGRYSQGKLTRAELLTAKRLIDDSGQARGPSAVRIRYRSGWMQLSVHLRSGRNVRNWIVTWPPGAFRPAGAAPSQPADVKLAIALRTFLASRPGKPYDGPMAMHVLYGGTIRGKRYTRQQVARLPAWSVAGLSVTDSKARSSGLVLDESRLKDVRAALAKTDVYKYNKYTPCQVFVAPYVKDAAELQFGRRR